MIKKIVIAGCRDYENYEEAKNFIDICLSKIKKENEIIIISGGCRGADKIGERYAKENGYKIELYKADWDKYGRSAGPKRNEDMAKNCDYVIAFWDGKSRGTGSMLEFAKRENKPIRIKYVK